MGDAEAGSALPGSAGDEANSGVEEKKTGDAEKNGKPKYGSADNRDTAPPSDDVARTNDATELNHAGEDITGDQLMADGVGTSIDEPDTAQVTAENGSEEGAPEGGKGKRGASSAEGPESVHDDDLYCSVRGIALVAINAAREARELAPLSLDGALVVPATTHCRTMCENSFLSHWDIAGRKPYQRYANFAYGQHVSEVVFGFDVHEATEDEISSKINECIKARLEVEEQDEGGINTNHLLSREHTHIGIGVYVSDGKLRYVEVYADRYLELLDSPSELPAPEDNTSNFHISVRTISPDVGPYACLVFHDPVGTPLTIGELQQQFIGPYSDLTTSQVGIVWPWQMEDLENGAFDIPISVSPVEAGTYYVQILVRGDPGNIPYDTEPAGGLPLPGGSFCGASLVLRAADETADNIRVSDLDEEGGMLADDAIRTLEEREARAMASTTALRRDLAPVVSVRVVQETGGCTQQVDNYETSIFMPPERAENMAQLNLGVHFLRLGAWDELSSHGLGSDETSSRGNESATVAVEDGGEAVSEAKDINGEDIGADLPAQPSEAAADGSGAATEAPATPGEAVDVEGAGAQSHDVGDNKNNIGEMNDADAERTGEGGGQAAGEGSEGEHGVSRERVNVSEHAPPLVVTDIVLVTFREGENVEAPYGFELLPGDLANPLALNSVGDSKEEIGEKPEEEEGEGKGEAKREGEGDGEGGISEAKTDANEEKEGEVDPPGGRDMVFLCVQMARYTEKVSPVTDIALVYGTSGFQMGFGFVTVPMPQVVNDLYGSTIHLCYKKAGASLALIQQMAERTAEKTAKQIQQHLGIEEDDGDGKAESIQDEVYEVDTNMTPEQILEWEEKRNQEAAERADRREQMERDRRHKEATDEVRRRIEEALKEKEELIKENGEWQKKIAALMLTQQKTREEARTDHGGRGVEKEAIPAHESEKHYAECLSSIVSCREKLQEQQAEYDTVAIALQTRLDGKECKSREISDSFREFKREIARTAEHSRTGKAIPKSVISQFEAAEAKKDEDIEKVRLKNINLRMMLKKVEGNLRAKEQLAEGLHLIDFEQLKIENQTVNEKIEERNEEILKLRKKNTTTVQILTHTKEKLQFVAAENAVTSNQLSGLEEDLNQERDCLTRGKKERDHLRAEVASLRQSQGFANSDLLILDFERRKWNLKKLGQKIADMQSKYRLLLLEQERLQEGNEERLNVLKEAQLVAPRSEFCDVYMVDYD